MPFLMGRVWVGLLAKNFAKFYIYQTKNTSHE